MASWQPACAGLARNCHFCRVRLRGRRLRNASVPPPFSSSALFGSFWGLRPTMCMLQAYLLRPLDCRPKQQQAEDSAPPMAGGAAAALPPCVLEHHDMHGGLSYQLHYRLQPV